MNPQFQNTAIVILANAHNPSLVSDYFLIKTGIISQTEDLDRNNYIVTPPFSQMILKDGTTIQIDSQRATFTSTVNNNRPAEIAKAYCESLPFIQSSGVGINFDYLVSDYDFDKWFFHKQLSLYKNTLTRGVDCLFTINEKVVCNVKVTYQNYMSAMAAFNFHQDTIGQPQGEIGIDFIQEKREYQSAAMDFIKGVFI